LEGTDPQPNIWPAVPPLKHNKTEVVYSGAGSELFHGIRTTPTE
jgi:hypothetical protein